MDDPCETAYSLTHHPIYRTAQFHTLAMLLLSIAPLCYFIFRKLIYSTFHGNLKWVLIGYFGSTLTFSIYFIFLTLYHISAPFLAKDKCSLIIQKDLFKFGHLGAIVEMTIPMFLPFSITIERIFATQSAEHYEHTPVVLGPVLTVASVIIDISAVAFVYKDEPFDAGSVSFAFIPITTASRMFTFYWTLFFFNIINFGLNLALLRQNRKMKKMNISSLTVRYQLEEIFLSTRFAVLVVFVHICFLGFYLTFVIGVRNYGYLMISDPITVTAFRAAAISLIATYNLIIGFVAVYLFKRIQKKKKGEIKGEVQMKATGRDGARNYDNAIFSVWNSLSSSAERSRR